MVLIFVLLVLLVTTLASIIDYKAYKSGFRTVIIVLSGVFLIGWIMEPKWWPSGTATYALLTEGYNKNSFKVSDYDSVYSIVETHKQSQDKEWLSSVSMISEKVAEGNKIDLFGYGSKQELPIKYKWGNHLTNPSQGIVLKHAPHQVEVGEVFEMKLYLINGSTADSIWIFRDGEDLGAFSSDEDGIVLFEDRLFMEGPVSYEFEWENEGERLSENLNIRVVQPQLLTFGVLLYSPSFEINYLITHFGERGHTIISRNRIGQDRFRYDAINANTASAKAILDQLAHMDILILDASEYLMLSTSQQSQIKAAISQGLDVLLRPPSSETSKNWASVFSTLTDSDISIKTLNRIEERNWVPDMFSSEEVTAPISLLNLDFEDLPENSVILLDYGVDEPISVRIPNGSGSVTGQLFYQTYSWLIRGESHLYNTFWTDYLSKIVIVEGSEIEIKPALPKVNNRIDIIITQPDVIQKVKIGSVFETDIEEFPVLQSPGNPEVLMTQYWPKNTGWHQIEYSDKKAWIYVYGEESWKGHDEFQRFAKTENELNKLSQLEKETPESQPRKVPDGIWLIGFILLQGILWAERKILGIG